MAHKQALEYALKRMVQASPMMRSAVLASEALVKRSLATMLWSAWRLNLNPFKFLRGIDYTTGRSYIEQFLQMYAHECSGVFLEFGDPYFRDYFDMTRITSYDIMDIVEREDVTILADIQECPEIASNTYDVIVCTQVLEHIPNPFKAVAELQRILKPGGRLLLTVPAAFQYHAVPHDYWRYTRDSLHLLLDPLFRQVVLHSYGNQLVVVAAYWYWMVDHLPPAALTINTPDCPTILCVYAVK